MVETGLSKHSLMQTMCFSCLTSAKLNKIHYPKVANSIKEGLFDQNKCMCKAGLELDNSAAH